MQAFDDDPVFPVIAHVVGVAEGCGSLLEELDELRGAGPVNNTSPCGFLRVGNTVARVVHLEHPEVIVEPTHGGLDDAVQGLQAGRGAHRHAAPDQGLDVGQFDAQDGDLVGVAHSVIPGRNLRERERQHLRDEQEPTRFGQIAFSFAAIAEASHAARHAALLALANCRTQVNTDKHR